MLLRFNLSVTFPELLFDFFSCEIDGGVQITFDIFCKQIRSRDGKSHRALKLFFRSLGVVVFEGNTGVYGESVKVFQFVYFLLDVIFDCFGESYIMRRKNQFHTQT